MSLRLAILVPVPYRPGDTPFDDTLIHRAIPLTHARAFARQGLDVHVFFDGPRERVERDRVTVHIEPSRWPAIRGHLRGRHLVRAAAKIKPDILHIHHIWRFEQLWASRRLSCPVFAEYHGGQPSRWMARRTALRRATRSLAGTFFSAPEHARRFIEAGTLHPRVPVHTSPEASARWPGRPPRPRVPGPPRFCVVGLCEPPKAPWTTLRVFRKILDHHPDAQLIWATKGGTEHQAIRKHIESSPDIARQITFGPVSFDGMPDVYAGADVTLVTSEREIGGTVLSESLSQGTPVAAFTLPTFDALAAGCPAVHLVTPRDPEALAVSALHLAGRTDLRSKAYRHFEENLSFDAIARQRRKIYEAAQTALIPARSRPTPSRSP